MRHADLVIIDADIRTMDVAVPRVQALAVTGGRVIALGRTEDIRGLAGPGTKVIDAGGRLVLPGFQDTHIHLADSGYDYASNCDLTGVRSPEALIAALASYGRSHDQAWVRGTGWYSGIFGEHNLNRAVLDRASPDRPCFIMASDGHNACLNSAGLAATGIGAGTTDPDDGHFVRDAAGQPTGMLYESAVAWVMDRMPQPTDADYAMGVRWSQALANRHGITGVIDAKVKDRHVRIYRSLAKAGALTLRVGSTALVSASDSTKAALERVSDFRADSRDGLFRVHSAKFFLDGVVENRTAAMIAPYADTGGNAPLMFDPAQINEMFTAFDAARFQIHVHAIGDLATRAALDGVQAARQANADWPALHQIAHIQFIDPADIPRFRALGVMANVQPLWARNEASVTEIAIPAVGADRAQFIYAFRSLLDAGAQMALSSDWGVSTLNPFEIIETAVTRQPPHKEGDCTAFLPGQRISRAEAVAGYTTAAAAAAWRTGETGSLALGKYADLIMLDRDIFTCDTYAIGDTKVLLTLLGGHEVWTA